MGFCSMLALLRSLEQKVAVYIIHILQDFLLLNTDRLRQLDCTLEGNLDVGVKGPFQKFQVHGHSTVEVVHQLLAFLRQTLIKSNLRALRLPALLTIVRR